MDEAKTLDEIMEGRFIKRVMTTAAQDIDAAQVKYMGAHGFENTDWFTDRHFKPSESALEYSQKLKHRFVDMKFISKGMEKHKKKSHPVYNKIIWGHYNNIIRELAYGYTEAVKEEMRNLEE
ncbi:MAG: hypothetical protein V4581_01115 [Bacteroidota bacterium]